MFDKLDKLAEIGFLLKGGYCNFYDNYEDLHNQKYDLDTPTKPERLISGPKDDLI